MLTLTDVARKALEDPAGTSGCRDPEALGALRMHELPSMVLDVLRENLELIERWTEDADSVELPREVVTAVQWLGDYLRNRIFQLGQLVHSAGPGMVFESAWRAWAEHENAVMFEQFCEEKPGVRSARAEMLLDLTAGVLGQFIPVQQAIARLPELAE